MTTTTDTPDTTRLSDEQVNDLLEFDVGSPRVANLLSGHIDTIAAELARVEAENERLALAIRDIAFGNLSTEEIERIASDAWYTAKEVTGADGEEVG